MARCCSRGGDELCVVVGQYRGRQSSYAQHTELCGDGEESRDGRSSQDHRRKHLAAHAQPKSVRCSHTIALRSYFSQLPSLAEEQRDCCPLRTNPAGSKYGATVLRSPQSQGGKNRSEQLLCASAR